MIKTPHLMKTTIHPILSGLAMLGLLTFSSCKKEDTIAPVVTLKGSSPMTIDVGAAYTEPGATATDDVDGDISSKIAITGTVTNTAAGTYTRTYAVTDAAGNTGTASRVVNVVLTRASYLGSYTGTENCPSPYGLSTVPAITAGAGANKIVLSPFYFNGGELIMTVNGGSVTIDAGQNPAPVGASAVGTGTFNGSTLVLSLTMTENGLPPVNCTATYSK
jgi:hypothetical protein